MIHARFLEGFFLRTGLDNYGPFDSADSLLEFIKNRNWIPCNTGPGSNNLFCLPEDKKPKLPNQKIRVKYLGQIIFGSFFPTDINQLPSH